MNSASILALLAAVVGSAVSIIVLFQRRSIAAWCFALGMVLLAIESALRGLSITETNLANVQHLHIWIIITGSLIPAVWIAFSLTYLRGDYARHLFRWRFLLLGGLLIPVCSAVVFRDCLIQAPRPEYKGSTIDYGPAAYALNIIHLLSAVLILMNLEKTLRGATGTARWKIKFAVLGVSIIFGARIYTKSQAMLFTGFNIQLTTVESLSFLIGILILIISLTRQGFNAADIYPSRAVLHSTFTLFLAGLYLFAVGVLAQLAAKLDSPGNFQLQTMVVLIGLAALAVMLLSDRLRQRLRAFIGRHFQRPQHDSLALWTKFTHRLSGVTDQRKYCMEVVKLLAESFHVLTVTIWVHDDRLDALVPCASTDEQTGGEAQTLPSLLPAKPLLEALKKAIYPFKLSGDGPPGVDLLSSACQPRFLESGVRLCLPLVVADRSLGTITLVDRVNDVPYSSEELDLLNCIGEQIAAGLRQKRLTEELMQGRELGAFQAMSTFFIHDLKNSASSLSLLLQNMPVHFDDPQFRTDALRAIESNVKRINQIIGRLGSLRHNLDLHAEETNIVELVNGVLDQIKLPPQVELILDLRDVPPIMADSQQLENVVTNILINASEALPKGGGKITLQTSRHERSVVISVADNGCGMTSDFVQNSLFRPFMTTKKKGLGIGMFHCQMIVAAHMGSLQVQSTPGCGSTFRIILPLKPETP